MLKSIYKIYKYCIFCPQKLPNDTSGRGEHVIPESIFGFWRIFDICNDCKKHFGDNVDGLAIKNSHILNAMSNFNKEKVEKYFDEMPFSGKDSKTNNTVKMVRKKGELKAKVVIKNSESIQYSEEDFEEAGWKIVSSS